MESKEQAAAILTSALLSKLDIKLASLDKTKDIQVETVKEDTIKVYQFFLEKLESSK